MSGLIANVPVDGCKRLRLPRLLFLAFNVLAFLRMLIADGRPLATWLAEVLDRLGFTSFRAERSIWIHGEGMGEFNAASQLIHELRQRYPGYSLVFTSSRCATRDWLIGKYPADIRLGQPWDTPLAPARFFRRLQPRLIVLLDFHDGFCPGALWRARASKIPVVVVNARTLPAHKPLRYRVADRLGLVDGLAPLIDHYCAQDEATCWHLRGIGVSSECVAATGNLKFDGPVPGPADLAAFRAETGLSEGSPIITIGCIHPEESRPIVAAMQKLWSVRPELRFIVAPLSPQPGSRLGRRLRSARMSYVRRSKRLPLDTQPVLLLDSFNELATAYGVADVVVMAGSFRPGCGGHNLVEAAVQGKPIVFGPFMDSQRQMMSTFLADDAALQRSVEELAATLEQLLNDAGARARLGERARAVVQREAGATGRTLAVLEPLLRPGLVESPALSPLKRVLAALVRSRVGQAMLALRSRRLATLTELRTRLGDPDTILCLGNGPSSEEPALDEIHYDALFRVNWRWRERGRLDLPDVVFTGDRTSLARCPRCIFGFRTIAEEVSILTRTYFAPRGRVNYLTAERLPLCVNERWPARPTNGAVMIATAAALQPRRLVIAGIDLFEHPEGAYPGATGANRYAAVHDRSIELDIMRRALAEFRGDVIVIGAALRQALAEKRAA
jgi:3-deoxy-D-manno-octulosonic-acid transferase